MSPPTGYDRGQSGMIGYALLFSVAFLIVAVVLVVGGAAISDTERSAEMTRAEQGFAQLDNRLSRISAGSSKAQTVDLGIDAHGPSSNLEFRNTGTISVSYVNTTTGSETQVYEGRLGTLAYTNGDQTLGYQGGGVWRHRANETQTVSPPEFFHRDDTLILPIITVDANGKLDSEITVQRESRPVERYPNTDVNSEFTNRIVDKKVEVTVQSRYYKGWGTYFQRQAAGGVDYDHASDSVSVTFFNPPPKVSQGLSVFGGGGGTLRIQSGKNSVINSYNSSAVPSDAGPDADMSKHFDGDAGLQTDKDVRFGGNAEVTGNLTTSGTVTKWTGNKERIGGHLRYGDGSVSSSDCSRHVGSWCAKNASDLTTSSVDGAVEEVISNLAADNDNGEESCFSESAGVEFGGSCGSEVTLESGDYYTAADLQVDNNEKLLLDTRDGDIRIAVGDDRNVQFDGANVTVVGDGTVRIYATNQYQIQNKKTKVWNRGWDAGQFWLYCSANCQVQFQSNPTFVGVVYAPSDSSASNAQVQIGGGKTDVYGAIVGGGQAELQSNADIHFDRNLQTKRVLTKPSVSYLHVRVHEDKLSSSE